MSRMGEKPIIIPQGTEVETKNSTTIVFKAKGKQMIVNIHPKMKLEKKDDHIIIKRKSNDKFSKSLHGVTRKIILNAITGVNTPFEKKLEINGVGYRVKLTGNELEMALGYSHPIKIKAPEGINFDVKKNVITISGIDKQQVGQTAAIIRSARKPEPYKGKGIKYIDEIIVKKAGKAAKAAGESK